MDKVVSQEDYLEAILVISTEKDVVRSVDVANKLGFSRASVSIALKKLVQEDLVLVDDKGLLTLTKKGEEIASKTLEKHEYLTNMLVRMGVNEEKAEETACNIEHQISDDVFETMKDFINNHSK